jgi:RNA polymerase sigma-70 factor (ECF subfamily)
MTGEFAIPEMEAGGAAETSDRTDCGAMDEAAFAAFYQRTARPLWAYLARVSNSATLADDLMQESFVRFLGSGFQSAEETACRRYLFRIATNLLHDHWRRPALAGIEDLPEMALAAPDGCMAEQVAAHLVLEPALAKMKPRERQLLWLAYAEGATHQEIAAMTGLKSASIRLLLFRARRKLARLLQQSSASGGRRA